MSETISQHLERCLETANKYHFHFGHSYSQQVENFFFFLVGHRIIWMILTAHLPGSVDTTPVTKRYFNSTGY